MKECPRHPHALAMEIWHYCPLCGTALVESVAGMPVIVNVAAAKPVIVSTETLYAELEKQYAALYAELDALRHQTMTGDTKYLPQDSKTSG